MLLSLVLTGINIFKADVLAALFVGGMIPVVFSALAMKSVGKAAMDMVMEVRRQFKEIPGIMEGQELLNMASVWKFHESSSERNDASRCTYDCFPYYNWIVLWC